MKRVIICSLVFCSLTAASYAQAAYKSFYVSIADLNILSYNRSPDHTFAKPFFKADSLNQVAASYDVLKFSQSFPTSKHEDMLRVWTITSDDTDSLYLAEKLHLLYPDIFLFIEEDISGCNCPKRN